MDIANIIRFCDAKGKYFNRLKELIGLNYLIFYGEIQNQGSFPLLSGYTIPEEAKDNRDKLLDPDDFNAELFVKTQMGGLEFFGQMDTYIKEIDDNIYKPEAVLCLVNHCYNLANTYFGFKLFEEKHRNLHDDERVFNTFIGALPLIDKWGCMLSERVFLHLGYWKAQMDIKKRNKKAAAVKKDKKNDAVEKIRNLLKKYPDLSDKRTLLAFRTSAMEETGATTTRTIDNYLKIIGDKLE